MAKFERVSKYSNSEINMPIRKTAKSAGYDFEVAEDILVDSYKHKEIVLELATEYVPHTLEEIAEKTKRTQAKPTLIPTGMKCQLADDEYLELSIRSSGPLKHWLMLANSVGIIDADYYNNPDNEGHIYFQVINSHFNAILIFLWFTPFSTTFCVQDINPSNFRLSIIFAANG